MAVTIATSLSVNLLTRLDFPAFGGPVTASRTPSRSRSPLGAASTWTSSASSAAIASLAQLSSRSEEHTSELQSLMRISYAVFCLKKKTDKNYRGNKKRDPLHN